MNLHQYFTDFEPFKARFRKKQCTFIIKKNISTRYGILF